ncbi:MAG: hypothetical protein ACR2RD_04005, partial [Woeseiaceae bacterium]
MIQLVLTRNFATWPFGPHFMLWDSLRESLHLFSDPNPAQSTKNIASPWRVREPISFLGFGRG